MLKVTMPLYSIRVSAGDFPVAEYQLRIKCTKTCGFRTRTRQASIKPVTWSLFYWSGQNMLDVRPVQNQGNLNLV